MISCGSVEVRMALNSKDFQSRIVAQLVKSGIDATRATESEIRDAFVVITKESFPNAESAIAIHQNHELIGSDAVRAKNPKEAE